MRIDTNKQEKFDRTPTYTGGDGVGPLVSHSCGERHWLFVHAGDDPDAPILRFPASRLHTKQHGEALLHILQINVPRKRSE